MGAITSKGGSEKVGDVKMHAVDAVPPGWLVCDGALIPRLAYAALWNQIEDKFGAGDGVTTFALPDMRGEFPRGFDGGRGVDPGRVFGSAQGGEIQSHGHTALGLAATQAGGNAYPVPQMLGGEGDLSGPALTVSATGGAETRPRNVAMLFCIKYAG